MWPPRPHCWFLFTAPRPPQRKPRVQPSRHTKFSGIKPYNRKSGCVALNIVSLHFRLISRFGATSHLPNMICQFCQSTIFESGQLWGYHQKDLSSLQCSVDEQCLFCSTLYGDLGYWAPSFAQLELPSHFWNIRRQGGISREYPQYFAVSFRPISGPDRGSQGGLPERTYYIFEEQGELTGPSSWDNRNCADTKVRPWSNSD
ncbi:heterokaryon incompatibility protein [Macrophomina phaseolina MS6]|uniref:Heterokaryon incompatibility protein n=1 Tax=Macrophomina phaseolina (strain MS6) TaxID=1126212 RepID=K2RTT1_MACPH|nr:heterokaryon incompatibility protein [Macrophomina phaseolina MS6]